MAGPKPLTDNANSGIIYDPTEVPADAPMFEEHFNPPLAGFENATTSRVYRDWRLGNESLADGLCVSSTYAEARSFDSLLNEACQDSLSFLLDRYGVDVAKGAERSGYLDQFGGAQGAMISGLVNTHYQAQVSGEDTMTALANYWLSHPEQVEALTEHRAQVQARRAVSLAIAPYVDAVNNHMRVHDLHFERGSGMTSVANGLAHRYKTLGLESFEDFYVVHDGQQLHVGFVGTGYNIFPISTPESREEAADEEHRERWVRAGEIWQELAEKEESVAEADAEEMDTGDAIADAEWADTGEAELNPETEDTGVPEEDPLEELNISAEEARRRAQ